MTTTYQIKSSDLDSKIIESIKSNFPDEEIMIDVYPVIMPKQEISEITNPEIISRIKDIENKKNIVFPKIDL